MKRKPGLHAQKALLEFLLLPPTPIKSSSGRNIQRGFFLIQTLKNASTVNYYEHYEVRHLKHDRVKRNRRCRSR